MNRNEFIAQIALLTKEETIRVSEINYRTFYIDSTNRSIEINIYKKPYPNKELGYICFNFGVIPFSDYETGLNKLIQAVKDND